MKKCSECGTQCRDEELFCSVCGAKLLTERSDVIDDIHQKTDNTEESDIIDSIDESEQVNEIEITIDGSDSTFSDDNTGVDTETDIRDRRETIDNYSSYSENGNGNRRSNTFLYIIIGGLIIAVIILFSALKSEKQKAGSYSYNTTQSSSIKPSVTSSPKPIQTARPISTPIPTVRPTTRPTPKPLELSPFYGALTYYAQVPFYYASATSELKEGDILFTAAYAIDESVNRPWVEGVRGAGSGESLTLYFNSTQYVDVLSLRLGYARNSDLYYYNNRPKTIRFEFSDGSSVDYLFGDINQEQIIQLNKTVETSYIKMTILDVYSGECEDTCIYLVKAYHHY